MKRIESGIFLLVGCLSAVPSSWGDDALSKRVQAEYPPALAKLEARYGSMHGQARYHGMRPRRDKPVEEVDLKIEFAFAPELAKISITKAKPVAPAERDETAIYQTVHGVNSKYGFWLSRANPQDDFALRSITEDLLRARSNILNSHGGEVQCAFSCDFMPISRYFKYNVMQIASVTEVDDGTGAKDLLIRFSILPAPGKPRSPSALDTDGWLLVSPHEGWIVREYGSVASSKNVPVTTRIGKIQYARSSDLHLDPVKLIQQGHSGRVDRDPPSQPAASFELTFESVQYDALPEAQFRLPAYGLPEVDAAGNKGASLSQPIGLFGLSILGFGLAGGLKYASSRWNQS